MDFLLLYNTIIIILLKVTKTHHNNFIVSKTCDYVNEH